MIVENTKQELKVGIFVFISLLILMFFILSIGGAKLWTSGYRVDFIFSYVNGVKDGAPVRFAGVDAGEVKAIEIYYDPVQAMTKIRVSCWIHKEIKVPRDSVIWVNTLGLLGEKYIEIMPGKDYSQCLLAGQEMNGEDPPAMNDIIKAAKNAVDNIDSGVQRVINKEGTVGMLLYDDTLYKQLNEFVADIRKNPWKLFRKGKEEK